MHVVQMGRQLYPSHALFNTMASSASKESKASGKALSEANSQAGNGNAMGSEFAELDFNAFMHDDKTAEIPPSGHSDSSTGIDGFDWELPDVEPPTVTSVQPTKEESDGKGDQTSALPTVTRDLDWELPDVEPPTVVLEKSSEDQLKNNEDASQVKHVDFEFNEVSAKAEDEPNEPLSTRNVSLSDKSDSATEQVVKEQENFEERLNNLELELERLEEDVLTDVQSDEGMLGTEEYIETKLDLAMAYLDMGDPVGARNLLEEVLQEGNVDQKQRAEAFIAKLG
jgi:pilus assembly protein FimV